MKIDKTTMLAIALPLALCAAATLVVSRLGPGHKASAATASPAAAAPQNPAHERAALEEQLKQNPDHAPILLRLADLEQESGNSSAAVSYLKKVLAKDSQNEEARLELGRLLYDSGDVDGAIRETKQLLTDHPGQVDGLYNLGAIYANLNRFDLAKDYWSKAITTDAQSDSGRKAKAALDQVAKR